MKLQRKIYRWVSVFLAAICMMGITEVSIAEASLQINRIFIQGGIDELNQKAKVIADTEVLNKPPSLEDLQQVSEKISSVYRSNGYFLAKAYLPEQQAENGCVKFIVLEGRYGRIEVRNESWLSEKRLRVIGETLKPGMAIRKAELERLLLLLGDIPGMQVQSMLQPGEKVGTADLLIVLRNGAQTNVTVNQDNHGDQSVGQLRSAFNIVLNHPAGGRDCAEFGFVQAGEANMESGYFRYSDSVGNGGIQSTVSYAAQTYRLRGDYALLDSHGKSSVWDLTLRYPLRRTESNTVYAGIGVSRKKIQDWLLGGQDGKRSESVHCAIYGSEQAGNGNVMEYSLGYQNGLLISDSEGRKRFEKWNGAVALRRSWSSALYATVSAIGQWTPNELDGSEKMSVGGAAGVRSYEQGCGVGDIGWQLTAEVHRKLSPVLEVIGFADAGAVAQRGAEWRKLYGAGLGLAWASERWKARIDCSWKIGRADQERDDATRHWWFRLEHLL